MPGITLETLQRAAFFRSGAEPRSTWQVIGWWELRRIPFNLIVGLIGITTVIAILGYGVMANVFYTGGWVAELLVRRYRREWAHGFAPVSFAAGLAFSVVLTLTPVMIFLQSWLYAWLTRGT